MNTFRKIISTTLVAVLLCSMCMITASATPISQDVSADLSCYDEVVVFSEKNSRGSVSYDPTIGFESAAKNNVEQAIAGVKSLKLSEQGLSYLEESCLAELNEIALDPSCKLNEYSVLIPRSTTPSFYTTYRSTDFYTAVTSKSNITLQKNNIGTYEKLVKWASNLVNLTLSISGTMYTSLAWSALTASLPSNYQVHSSDWTDCYININPMNRALYVKEGTTYKNVANREYGTVRAYNVYHYNDATSATGAVTTNFPSVYYPDVTSSNNGNLLYTAYEVHRTGALAVNYLLKNQVAVNWG